jgi:hypothetical protein
MKRSLLSLLVVLTVACSTAKQSAEPVPEVDPVTDPTIVGAVDEAVMEANIQGEAAAKTGRRLGRVAGVVAAVFGGPSEETDVDVVERYRQTRDAVEATTIAIAAAKGAQVGAKRGYELDLQFAELHALEGVEVTRPFPDQIEARFAATASDELLSSIAAVFVGREERAIDLEAAGDASLTIRESLVERGLPSTSINAHRDDAVEGVLLRIRYKG